MDRRCFISAVGLGALGVGLGDRAKAENARAPSRSAGPLRLKLGCQSGPPTDDHFAFLARYGVTNICARAGL